MRRQAPRSHSLSLGSLCGILPGDVGTTSRPTDWIKTRPQPGAVTTPRLVPHAFDRRPVDEMRTDGRAFYQCVNRRAGPCAASHPIPCRATSSSSGCWRRGPRRAAPTNSPWHFVVVEDPAVKRRIREGAEAEERTDAYAEPDELPERDPREALERAPVSDPGDRLPGARCRGTGAPASLARRAGGVPVRAPRRSPMPSASRSIGVNSRGCSAAIARTCSVVFWRSGAAAATACSSDGQADSYQPEAAERRGSVDGACARDQPGPSTHDRHRRRSTAGDDEVAEKKVERGERLKNSTVAFSLTLTEDGSAPQEQV